MRCAKQILIVALLFALASASEAAKIIKVLPQYLDRQGRNALSPSLYGRDAYQAQLRNNPEQRSALQFYVQWKPQSSDWRNIKIRVELRGVNGSVAQSRVLEKSPEKRSWFSQWTLLKLAGKDYQEFGQMVAWRATLWDGDKQVAEQKSFLW